MEARLAELEAENTRLKIAKLEAENALLKASPLKPKRVATTAPIERKEVNWGLIPKGGSIRHETKAKTEEARW